ncbi:MAG: hypothetical protein LBI77_02695, partial [Puniceicoccales bacterium]|nr:hypothetical protein [Puniceicoccales bacterium]
MGISVEWGGKNVEVGYLAAAKVLGNGISGFFRMIFGKTTPNDKNRIIEALTNGQLEPKDINTKKSEVKSADDMKAVRNEIQKNSKIQTIRTAIKKEMRKITTTKNKISEIKINNEFVPNTAQQWLDKQKNELITSLGTNQTGLEKITSKLTAEENFEKIKNFENSEKKCEENLAKLTDDCEVLEKTVKSSNDGLEKLENKAKEILGENKVGKFEETMERLVDSAKTNPTSEK